ncbi:replication initiator [Streptomyces zagrosensis]|uniref:Uncharacterized protein n=1 Tax=Streptomyces zagrosensis TaxID=1042984 RepID=A0A7W9V190_9ACTN|nr:replication initiator [Streptomyces zagrosensis]MBB5938011.1 hypothetical protein [Streptomyces zagrosensis]
MLGFRGYFSTKSRRYSTTRGALRDARRAWHTEQARAHADLPLSDPTTTLVVGHWELPRPGLQPRRGLPRGRRLASQGAGTAVRG